jgi:hypothetical protein
MYRQYLTESHRVASGITSGSGSLPIPVHAGLISFFLGTVAVPLLSKLGDIQALGFGQVVFWRQLAFIVNGIVIWIFVVIRVITVELQVARSIVRKNLADVGAGITLTLLVRSDRSGLGNKAP